MSSRDILFRTVAASRVDVLRSDFKAPSAMKTSIAYYVVRLFWYDFRTSPPQSLPETLYAQKFLHV